jgi:tetratricopeptide (TPR) repeat protein
MDAGLLFQKGEVMFKKGEYDQAESLVHDAMQTDPENLEYRAMLAWIQAHRIGAPPDEHSRKDHYKRQIALLDEVIASDKNFAKALYYRGELLKRSGDEEKSYRDFRKVVQLDPRNIDAAREVRLYELRAKKKQGGLFGRLFKK